MSFYGIINVIIFLLLVPFVLGLSFRTKRHDFFLPFVKGYILYFAVMQCVFVPFVVSRKKLSEAMYCLFIVLIALAVISLGVFIFKRIRFKENFLKSEPYILSRREIIYLGLFLAIVLFQLFKAVFYVYADGDDAFYIATAQVADQSDTMYLRNPYMGDAMELNMRYALSPFPMWIASVARVSHLNAATVAHIFVSPVMIIVTYMIYDLIARELFGEDREKRYMFLCIIAVFVMFGGYSTGSAETFLLTRARQGKEALADVIIPFVFLMLFKMSEDIKNIKIRDVLIVTVASVAAGFTSLFGNILIPIMIFLFLLYGIYRKAGVKNLLLSVIPAIPGPVMVIIYVLLERGAL